MATSRQDAQFELWALGQDAETTPESEAESIKGLALEAVDELTAGVLVRAASANATIMYHSAMTPTGLPQEFAADSYRRFRAGLLDERRLGAEYGQLQDLRRGIEDEVLDSDFVMGFAQLRLEQLEAVAGQDTDGR